MPNILESRLTHHSPHPHCVNQALGYVWAHLLNLNLNDAAKIECVDDVGLGRYRDAPGFEEWSPEKRLYFLCG